MPPAADRRYDTAMRVAYLASGAAGMYCGSCLRDNRLAATLIAQGRDVVLMPLYTPLRTDEPDVSRTPVYFGGINVFFAHRFPRWARRFRFLTGVLDSPALLGFAGRFAGKTKASELGALTHSMLQGEDGVLKPELEKLIDGLRPQHLSLVNLPNLMFLGAAATLQRELGVKVVCTLSGEDIFLDALTEPWRSRVFEEIRLRSDHVDAFISVTKYYADHAAEHFNLPRERVHVVPLGISTAAFADRIEPSPTPTPTSHPILGYLGRICPDKGLHNLVDAWLNVRKAGVTSRLSAAGYLGPQDRAYLREIQQRIDQAGASSDFEYRGELSWNEKIEFLKSLHVFSLPTVYREAKGLPVLEALAAGIPVVQPRHGSFPELVEATGGGLLYDPDRPEELEAAIRKLLDDPELRTRLGREGQLRVRESFSETQMAQRTWKIYEACVRGH